MKVISHKENTLYLGEGLGGGGGFGGFWGGGFGLSNELGGCAKDQLLLLWQSPHGLHYRRRFTGSWKAKLICCQGYGQGASILVVALLLPSANKKVVARFRLAAWQIKPLQAYFQSRSFSLRLEVHLKSIFVLSAIDICCCFKPADSA